VVTIANTNTAMLYPNNAFAGGTLTCATNVTFSGSNAVAKFDLSGSAAAGNDKVVLENAKLTCNGATVVINAAGNLATVDYVLFDVGSAGSIAGSFANVPVWAGRPPAGSAWYEILNVGGTNVILRCKAPSGSAYGFR
jgi:hypothetical protein